MLHTKLLRGSLLGFTAIVTSVLAATALYAETLNFASPSAPRATLNQKVFEPWLAQIMEDAEGTLNIRRFYASPLGNYRNMYDRVNDGVVHIGFTTIAPIGGQFSKTDVASIPFEVENSYEGSVALWRLYEQGLISDEFKHIKPLGIFLFPNSALHTGDRPIHTLEDFKGIKMRTGGKMQSETLVRLGGAPVTTALADTYTGLERGVFDGAILPWTGVAPFRLDEVTQYHMNAPLGSSVAIIFMNKDTYEKLPKVAQDAIDNNSGLPLTKWAATHNDKDADFIEQMIGKKDDQIIYDIDPVERKRWEETIAPIVDDWIKRTENGEAILAAFRKEVQAIRAKQAPGAPMPTEPQE